METLKTPQRMLDVQAPIIPKVAEWIRQNPGTLSLGQGVVSYGPPTAAYQALQLGMADSENHKYRPVQGLPSLLEAFATKLKQENQVPQDGSRSILVTAGSNMGFIQAIMAITDPGDEVILQSPYYFNHEMAVRIASAKPVLVDTDAAYQLRVDAIEAAITPRTRAVVTISPNNPTGAVYPRHDLERVNQLCKKHGLYHIHDEAYEYFTHDGAEHFSPASIPGSERHTISLFSLSKGYGFASWRIGFMLVPAELHGSLLKIQDTLLICAPVVSQYAALGALSMGRSWVEEQMKPLRESRRILQEGLMTLGNLCEVPVSGGAFYYLVEVRTQMDPMDCVKRLIEEFKVAVVPGNAFGAPGCRLRISYGALTPETAREGVSRLTRGLKALT